MAKSPIYSTDALFFDMDYSKDSILHQKYGSTKYITIYCVPIIRTNDKNIEGYSYLPQAPSTKVYQRNMIVISHEGLEAGNGSTLAHELGHFFGLLHTHEGYDNAQKREPVDRIDCHTKGDCLCDTPADFNLYDRVDATDPSCGCKIGSPVKEQGTGKVYQPMVENIMSYSAPGCRTAFTNGQLDVIRKTALFYRNNLEHKISIAGNNLNIPDKILNNTHICRSLGEAKEHYRMGGKKKFAFIFIYKDSLSWCDRMARDILSSPLLSGYFNRHNNIFSIVFYDANINRVESVRDFLYNEINPYAYRQLAVKLDPDIVRFPGFIVVEFEGENQINVITKADWINIGYFHPHQVVETLNKILTGRIDFASK